MDQGGAIKKFDSELGGGESRKGEDLDWDGWKMWRRIYWKWRL